MAISFTYCGSSVQVIKAASVCAAGASQMPAHASGGCTLHCVTDGKGVLESPDGRFALGENTLYVTRAPVPYKLIPQADAPIREMRVSLSICHTAKAEAMLRYFTDHAFAPRTAPAHIGTLFARILHEYEMPSSWHADTLCTSVLELLTEIVKLYAPPPKVSADLQTDLNESRAFVLDELLQSVGMHGSLADLAKALGVCPRQAERILMSFYGSTFRKLRNGMRMAHAVALLEAGNASMEACAQSCGYASVTAFGKAFKETYGVTPKSYRARVQNPCRETGSDRTGSDDIK